MPKLELHQRIAHSWALYIDARRVCALCERISDRAEDINRSAHSRFFGSLQADYGSLALLRLSALYDQHHSGKTHSLPHLVKYLEEQRLDPSHTLFACFDAYGVGQVQPEDWRSAFFQFANQMDAEPLRSSIYRARLARNQVIAHVDRVTTIPVPTISYNEASLLLEHARRIFIIAGALFLNTHSEPSGEFGSSIAQHPTGLNRLIDRIGLDH